VNPNHCYHKALNAGKRLPEVEACILTSVMFSYHYALDVIKGRWIEAEDVIMTDPMYSYLYAFQIVRGKLPEKMHNMMILHAIDDPNRHARPLWHARYYFRLLENIANGNVIQAQEALDELHPTAFWS